MAGLTREQYVQYAKKIVSVLSTDTFYEQYRNRVTSGASSFKLVKKRLIQDISLDWIETIEDILPNLDHIVRNPRKFIVQEEDIVDVSLAKSISTESIKHLAQHTNMISKVEDDGTVIPNKILNITKEESFEIYENRFIYTLLLKLKDFVTMRYDKIKKATATQDVLELDAESKFNLPRKKITYRTEYYAQLGFDEVMQLDPATMEKVERVAKMDRIITDFLASPFAKQMRSSAPVRPPITRTNVILKEPNFKKALTLWQFIETYNVTAGFSASDDVTDYDISSESVDELKDMVTLNTMLFESLYDEHETDFDMADAAFADFMKLGDMNFRPDEIEHDEFAQKADEEELNKQSDKEEEVKPEEQPPKPEEEKPEEQPPQPEEQPPQEEPPVEEKKEEIPPPPEEKEVEKEVPQEVEKEKEVDKDLEVEAPPKEEPDMDEEPDEEQFDQNLFDVRKLYKRPEEDRLRQDEINRIKDAIDRCLLSYRKIKQEQLEEEQREALMRKRQEDLDRRAEALRALRDEEAARFGGMSLRDKFFGAKAAAIALPGKDKSEFALNHPELFYNKNEKLDFNDNDLDNIRRDIEEMEKAKRLILLGRLNMETGEVEGINEYEIPEAEKAAPAPQNVVADAPKAEEQAATAQENVSAPSEQEQKPSSKPARAIRNFKPVDINKVQVGDAPVSFGLSGDLQGSSMGFAMTGYKPVKIQREEVVDVREQPEEIEVPTLTPQPDAFNPWAVRPGKAEEPRRAVPSVRTFKPVDINKVQVGDAPVRYGQRDIDATGMGIHLYGSKAPRYNAGFGTQIGETEQNDKTQKAEDVLGVQTVENQNGNEVEKAKNAEPMQSVGKQTAYGSDNASNVGIDNQTPSADVVAKSDEALPNRAQTDLNGNAAQPWAITTIRGKKAQAASMRAKQTHQYKPIDESKVAVGNSPIRIGNAMSWLDFSYNNEYGKLEKTVVNTEIKPTSVASEEKPKAKRGRPKKESVDTSNFVPVEITLGEMPKKDKLPEDSWSLSPTTLNQHYSKTSGVTREFKIVDEKKVAVGDLPVNVKSAQDALEEFGIDRTPAEKPVIPVAKPKRKYTKHVKGDGESKQSGEQAQNNDKMQQNGVKSLDGAQNNEINNKANKETSKENNKDKNE